MVPSELPSAGRHRRLADSDDSDDEGPRSVLTTAKASDLCPKPFRLIAKNGGFTSLEDMSRFSELDYINLTGNELRTIHGLGANARLKTLILKGNKLSNIDPILKISALRVLDIADNEFATTEWLNRATFAPDLIALVARGNKLVTLEGLSCLKSLQTLVVSNNEIEDISPVGRLTNLTKFSAANNHIRMIPASFANIHKLCELRMAHNRISILPPAEVMNSLSSLKILDVGHNRIPSFENLAIFRSSLVQVNVRDNPACKDHENIVQYLKSSCTKLEIVDGQRIAGGRRKVRVNRQRLEAGFPLEPERKFARPPPSSCVKELVAKNESTEGDGNNTHSATKGTQKEVTKTVSKKRRRESSEAAAGRNEEYKKNVEAQEVKSQSDNDDKDAIDPATFLRMAKSRTGAMPLSNGKDISSSAKPKRKRNKRESAKKSSSLQPEFGAGGSSRW